MKVLEDFLSGVVILDVTIPVCRKFGEIRNYLRKEGTIVGNFDILIAATALANNLQVITENKSEHAEKTFICHEANNDSCQGDSCQR